MRLPRDDPLSWVPADREGLTLCDATSAVFAMEMDWAKQDITTFSWQKVLGGEGAHGVLILSPRAVERLETYRPKARPMPKIFRMTKPLSDPSPDASGRVAKLDRAIFDGATINTPSMMCVEDCLDALRWVESIGGGHETVRRSEENLKVVEDYVDEPGRGDWLQFLAKDPATRSNTSVCLTMPKLSPKQVKWLSSSLEEWNVALDCNSYVSLLSTRGGGVQYAGKSVIFAVMVARRKVIRSRLTTLSRLRLLARHDRRAHRRGSGS